MKISGPQLEDCDERSSYLPALAPTTILSLVLEQELTPLPGIFAGLVRLPNKRQTLQRKLCGVGETDTPTAHPSSLRQLCPVEIPNRLLKAAPKDEC